jgi:lipopolysaccharide transport system ATP-binding protein
MPDIVLEMDHVFKKFKKGEVYDSLRDLIPAMSRRVFGGARKALLGQDEFWALNDVSFSVAGGEALGIIGSNGAGKSTILKLLCGVMKATSGAMKVHGVLSALIEVGAGFHPDLTGRENVFLNGTILGMKKEQIRKKFDEIVDFSGLVDFIDTPVKRYSSGMYARLGFSVAAHVDPDILIVDEVLSVGDYLFQKKCIEKMNEIKAKGTTVIFVSHNLKAMAELCDTALLLDHGKCLMMGSPGEVVNAYLNQRPCRQSHENGPIISKVVVRGVDGEGIHFESGERAWIDIEVSSRERFEGLGLVIGFNDDKFNDVFNVSTSQLRKSPFAVGPGRAFT